MEQRPKFKQRLKTPQVLYAWICVNCHETGKGRAPGLCTNCKSPMTKEIRTVVSQGEEL